MRSTLFLILALLSSSLTFTACQHDSAPLPAGLPYQSSFQRDNDGWVAGITDYGTGQADIMEFKSANTNLPTPLDTTRKSILIESMNRSDDAFMFLKKKVTGLSPNTDYTLIFDIGLASTYPGNSIGSGGSPGGSVYLKAGATPIEPVSQLKDGFYSLNIDKGAQNDDGKDAIRLGDIATDDDAEGYKLITRTNADNPFTATANAQGELWLIVGTDSGFEGLTTLYYSQINVTLK